MTASTETIMSKCPELAAAYNSLSNAQRHAVDQLVNEAVFQLNHPSMYKGETTGVPLDDILGTRASTMAALEARGLVVSWPQDGLTFYDLKELRYV